MVGPNVWTTKPGNLFLLSTAVQANLPTQRLLPSSPKNLGYTLLEGRFVVWKIRVYNLTRQCQCPKVRLTPASASWQAEDTIRGGR